MKIILTVGTTPFNRLVEAADIQLTSNFQLTSQISQGSYIPVNHKYFEFSENIDQYFKESEIIIAHGGAGTIYKALELNKRLVIVPNLERLDNHQLDICHYMVDNHHALACFELSNLYEVVMTARSIEFEPYQPKEFIGIPPIRRYLGFD